MSREIDKIKVLVLTNNSLESQKYFNLFIVLLGDKIEDIKQSSYHLCIETDVAVIEFGTASESARGKKAHYLINLRQDKELHYNLYYGITTIHSMLKDDDKWSDLFNRL